MSLVDAFLLDPAPFEVWIAVRTNAKGSGTSRDPYSATWFVVIMGKAARYEYPEPHLREKVDQIEAR